MRRSPPFRAEGVSTVVCAENHVDSRLVAVVCHDTDTARTRFGEADGRVGV